MKINLPTLQGRFLRRYKRFFADVELDDGTLVTAHCPNTGSMLGCLEPGARAVLRDSQNMQRKLRFVLQALKVGSVWVNVDTSLPNAVVYEEAVAGKIPELAGYTLARREVKYGDNSRIDVLLEREDGARCYVEVKNTTLARGRLAQFPDAVTERGLKHLGELSKIARLPKHRAVQFFFVSRADVDAFAPAEDIDPAYARGLRAAAAAGVEIVAWSASISPNSLSLDQRLELRLHADVPM